MSQTTCILYLAKQLDLKKLQLLCSGQTSDFQVSSQAP